MTYGNFIRKLMNDVFETEFPKMAERSRACAEKLGVKPLFRNFYNFCVNAPRLHKGIQRVHCGPHVDWKNLAIFVCVVLVYGEQRYSWRSRCLTPPPRRPL